MQNEPEKKWFTAGELAAADLPDLPGSVRGINLMAERERWHSIEGGARRRAGRGGGWQYHFSVLPLAARKRLLDREKSQPARRRDRGTAWADFDSLPDKDKAKAETRVRALKMVAQLHTSGMSHVSAAAAAAKASDVSIRTLYNWQEMVEGIAPEDWLAYLAPRTRSPARKGRKADCSQAFMDHLKSLYLRLGEPTFRSCYRDACRIAKAESWDILTEKTAKRRLDDEVPRVTQVFMREGVKGLERCYPAQQRDRAAMRALEAVNADCHKIDVFVRWPDGTINRPQIVGFQDIYSGKLLSWRVDHDPNKVMVMAAFGDLVEEWGLPRHCLFDNGREFANKWMTGGTPTRFRFKVRDDDPLGVLPLLGIDVHWATPAHGQAKPIERAFRDLADDVAKDVRFHGAYVGRRPDAKPENYASRAVPAETFLRVLEERIAEHNARDGRLSHTCEGRSFDQTFADSYATAPIRKATEEQRRLWLMGQHAGRLRRDNGQLRLYGNYYHSDWMSQVAGKQIVARFDPEDLHSGVHIYAADGGYLGFAECRQKVGFFDVMAAKDHARRKRRILRAERELANAHAPVSVEALGEALDAVAPTPAASPEAKVVKPVFTPGGPRPYRSEEQPEIDAARAAMIVALPQTSNAEVPPEETADERFARAQDILKRAADGKAVGREEARWVTSYRTHPEYLARLEIEESFGKGRQG